MIAQTTGERTLTIDGHTATVSTWRRAYERAKSEGVKVYHLDGEWYATSVSKPGERHHVNGACDCKGAERGLLCKHVAAVVGARYSRGELVRCEVCGQVGKAGEEVTTEQRWLGGHGYVEHTHCVNPSECWERFDKAHGLAS